MKKVAVLGSTGSIGRSTLAVLGLHPDRYRVQALAARGDVAGMLAQCLRHEPEWAVLEEPAAAAELELALRKAGSPVRVAAGADAIVGLAADSASQVLMAAISGAAGLRSTLAAARAGKRLLLANKESAVMAGPLLMAAVQAGGAELVPIDSEHNAIFQCLPAGSRCGTRAPGVRRLILTASGGPFLDWPAEAIARATPEQACAHPRWQMGRKISVDSATLMNKGLEVIEATVLFAMPAAEVAVLVHPQSIVHSLVEYLDGSTLAQLGAPDMRTPIAQALAWPERMAAGVEFLDLVGAGGLEFRHPDRQRFPCLALAEAAARSGGPACTWLNAADEVAVQAFLDRQLNFADIPAVIEAVMAQLPAGQMNDLEDVAAIDRAARACARAQLPVRAVAGARQ
jgi:1-deoxy-D-xylulose-5-phosphate reductoisomerase